ncbi:MAG: nitrogen fixation protein NifX [Gammaproteobacteria bacterium]|nr:nitrogen fixation protein NifX [Gammaproteobacteria bacterium]
MQAALKIAFASSDRLQVNQHFGTATAFAIYAVTPEKSRFAEAIVFSEYEQDGNEDKLQAKIHALQGCAAVYSQAVGASAIGQLRNAGIEPVKVAASSDIQQLLAQLHDDLQQPRGWLQRALSQLDNTTTDHATNRFDQMEAQGWSE